MVELNSSEETTTCSEAEGEGGDLRAWDEGASGLFLQKEIHAFGR